MERTFQHSFEPPTANPVTGPLVSLTATEIEDAGIREILQTPGPKLACWSFVDALLEPTGGGSPFRFREPLGQAREVKVALSGLLGRFVARAYLERHVGLSFFAHLGQSSIALSATKRIRVVRRSRGDLPDWIACKAGLTDITVAEAKGCHDKPGPSKALARAWTQAGRIRITCKGSPVALKRIAIATRWGSTTGGQTEPMIAVRDPEEIGEPMSDDDTEAMFIGLVRRHAASLLKSLGHDVLAASLVRLSEARTPAAQGVVQEARGAFVAAVVSEQIPQQGDSAIDDLFGGVVTRGGPVSIGRLSRSDERSLARLNLRPVFVGLERMLIKACIEGDGAQIRSGLARQSRRNDGARHDGAGGWIIPLGQ